MAKGYIAIFRMPESDRAAAAARHVGRWVTVRANFQRSKASEDTVYHGYLVSLARIPGAALLIVISKRLTADGIGDVALPLSQVRTIERAEG
jgi:hypothetical protein